MVLFSYLPFAFEALYLHLVRKRLFYATLAILLFVIFPLAILFIPANGFPRGALVEVRADASFAETASALSEENIIGSPTLFKALARLTGADTSVKAGRYLFSEPEGIAVVLYRLRTGDSGIRAIKVTFPEGITVREMGDILSVSLPGFDANTFVGQGKQYEGYLFPDTYSFYADATPAEVIERMRGRFDEIWDKLDTTIPKHPSTAETTTFNEGKERVVIMASILEKETKSDEDRAKVAAILWNRIGLGMPLQVDAVFGYIHGVDTYAPTLDDLEVDSPYNTYKNPDLPPGPIGNPGEHALRAALAPDWNPNLYYLTGKDGTVYYAKTFEEHKKNKELYLH